MNGDNFFFILKLAIGGRYELKADGLWIKDVGMNDAGVYQCRAQIPSLSMFSLENINVEVKKPGKFDEQIRNALRLQKEKKKIMPSKSSYNSSYCV